MSTPSQPLWNNALWNTSLFGSSGLPAGSIQVGHGLLYPALRKAAVTLGPQRIPSPAQFQDAIEELNRLLGSLNCDPLWIYGQDILEFPLEPGKKIYTIGIDPTGQQQADFPVPVPRFITQANYIFTNGPNELRYPLGLLTPQMWGRIRLQDIGNTIPQGIYFDRGYPIATIYIYGQPAFGKLELYVWHLIPQAQTLTDAVVLPQGYEDAIVLNLAVRLVTHFPLAQNVPRQVDPNLYIEAKDSLMRLESLNAPQPVLDIGWPCGGSRGDSPWFTTQFGPAQQL